MKIAYYLSQGSRNNLYCGISDGTERISIPLGHTISPDDWNPARPEEMRTEPYYFMLTNLNNYLITQYEELKSAEPIGVLTKLKTNVETLVDTTGIESLGLTYLSDKSLPEGILAHESFLHAFERHSGLSKGEYRALGDGYSVDFHTSAGEVYTIDTYEGLTRRLQSFVLNRMYDNIRLMTNEAIWSEVFDGLKVEKQLLFPKLRDEWEIYRRSQPTLSEERMAESWRDVQVFMAGYEATNGCIALAYEIDESILFPLIVLSLLNIYMPDSFYTTYCSIEFSSEEWEGIVTETNLNNNSTIFFIKIAEL